MAAKAKAYEACRRSPVLPAPIHASDSPPSQFHSAPTQHPPGGALQAASAHQALGFPLPPGTYSDFILHPLSHHLGPETGFWPVGVKSVCTTPSLGPGLALPPPRSSLLFQAGCSTGSQQGRGIWVGSSSRSSLGISVSAVSLHCGHNSRSEPNLSELFSPSVTRGRIETLLSHQEGCELKCCSCDFGLESAISPGYSDQRGSR